MLVYGVPAWGELVPIANRVGVKMGGVKAKGRGWQFSLQPDGKTFWRLNARGSKMPKACWHGHVAFFQELFVVFPEARIITGMATYNGRQEFERLHDQTFGLVNHTGDECTCGKERKG